MLMHNRRSWLGVALGLILTGAATAADKETLQFNCGQKEFLSLEPILVTVRAPGNGSLPAVPGKGKGGTLRFSIEPAVNPRKAAKPLPLEGQTGEASVSSRRYDLFEHFAFPDKGGTWTVRAVLDREGGALTSEPISITIRKPAANDKEQQPVARIHHTPWSNYDKDKFCGDTFDLVKSWPDSRLARYCHYWNGRYSQNKKEYDKAIASYRTVVEKFPDFPLADDAAFGIVECLHAQKQFADAHKANLLLRDKVKGKSGAVAALVEEMGRRLSREADAKR